MRDFDSWDLVDTACCYLYAAAKPAWDKIYEWSSRRAEFEKRAAFSLAAYLSYKDKTAEDARFERFLSVIEREACDERNFVRKAVNWALRNIGKRNLRPQSCGNSCCRADPAAGFAHREVDRGGRAARTEERSGAGAAAKKSRLRDGSESEHPECT